MPQPPLESLKESDAVFSGKVIRKDTPLIVTSSGDLISVTFQVSKVWKGPVQKEIQVKTAVGGATCGYYFEEGKEYLVYANEYEGSLHSGLCSRTSEISFAKDDFLELGTPQVPIDKPYSPTTDYMPFILGLIVGLIIGLSAYFIIKKKPKKK